MSTTADPQKLPTCPHCGNRLRLRPDQVGTQVMCPKCRATFVVGQSGQPGAAAAAEPSGDDDAYEPEIPLARTPPVPDEQMVDIGPTAGWHADYGQTRNAAEQARAAATQHGQPSLEEQHLASARARGIIRDEIIPDPPRWTFFSGVFTFPWQGVNLGRWASMSLGLSASLSCLWTAADMLGLFRGGVSVNAILGLFVAVFSIVVTLAAGALTGACFLAAVQSTADGHDSPQDAGMPEGVEWLLVSLGLVGLWATAAAVGFPFSLLPQLGPAACLVSSMILFPILVLGALENASFLVPYSPTILATLVRYPQGWLMFYLVTTPILAAAVAALDAGLQTAPYAATLLLGPAVAAVVLIYGRLLGRLAWKASGAAMAPLEAGAEVAGDRPPSPRRQGKAPRIKIAIQGESPDAGSGDSSPAEPPPRLNFHRRQ